MIAEGAERRAPATGGRQRKNHSSDARRMIQENAKPRGRNRKSTLGGNIWTAADAADNPFLINFHDDSESDAELSQPNGDISRMVKKQPVKGAKVTASKTSTQAELEALRKQIATKESELQQQRQRKASTPASKGVAAVPSPLKTAGNNLPAESAVKENSAQPHNNIKHPREEEAEMSNKKTRTVADEPKQLTAAVLQETPAALNELVSNSFQLLRKMEMEEEALDKDLEAAQQLRHRCEVRERLARIAYREAQEALRLANAECEKLHQRRELLSLKLKAAELRHYSSKAYMDEPLLLLENHLSSSSPPLPGVPSAAPPTFSPFLDESILQHGRRLSADCGQRRSEAQQAGAEDSPPQNGVDKNIEAAEAVDSAALLDPERSPPESCPDGVRASEPIRISSGNPQVSTPISSHLQNGGETGDPNMNPLEDTNKNLVDDLSLRAAQDSPVKDLQDSCLNVGPDAHEHDYIALGNDNDSSNMQPTSPVDQRDNVFNDNIEVVHVSKEGTAAEVEGLLIVFRRWNFEAEARPRLSMKENHTSRGMTTPLPHEYESPLVNFKSFRVCPRFSSAFGFKEDSITWSHAIDPFKPLCKYEHRGKCNNERCTMQHGDQYKLEPVQLTKDLQRYMESNSVSDAILAAAPTLRKWTITQVPTYCIGTYLIRGSQHNPIRGSCSGLYSLLSTVSMEMPLPPDMPCLLMGSHGTNGSPTRGTRILQAELPGDFSDVDHCLDTALAILHYDANNFKSTNCLKNALYVLSRSLETNRHSISLWVVYLTLFYKQSTSKEHDMFLDAIQCNSSYTLWSMLLNSRSNLKVQIDSFELALVSLCDAAAPSACILDIALKMLHTLAVSERQQLIISWLDDLVSDTSNEATASPKRKCTAKLLRSIQPFDACVLWVSCTYILAYGALPEDVVLKLGCNQELPSSLEWKPLPGVSEDTRGRILKVIRCGGSSGAGCLELRRPSTTTEKEVLAMNFIKLLVALGDLQQAAAESQLLMRLHPCSVKVIVLYAKIQKRLEDREAWVTVFQDAVLNWPTDKPGSQLLWNQYAAYTLEWSGEADALAVLEKCAAWARELFHLPCSKNRQSLQPADVFRLLSSINQERSNTVDWKYALLNLSLYEALRRDVREARQYLERALMADGESGHCWYEYAAFRFFSYVGSSSSHDLATLFLGLTTVLDWCAAHSQLTYKLRPLGREFLKEVKKPRNRCFIDSLLGAARLEYSFLNSLLAMAFGPGLLPGNLKAAQQLAGGLLDYGAGNTRLALALCEAVKGDASLKSSTHPSNASTKLWAVSLLISSLQLQSPGPEEYWLKARDIFDQLQLEECFPEFYQQAEAAYPFSAKLWRCRLAYFSSKNGHEEVAAAARRKGLDCLLLAEK